MGKHQQFMSDILTASTVVHNQLTRLNMLDKKFILMDKDLRYKIAANIKVGNNATARSLAIELANIHRVQRTTRNMSLALEVVVIRFSTINEFAMVLDTINPTIDMIKEIQSDISRSVPAASNLLSEMTSMTSDVLHNSNIKSDVGKISTSMDADALAREPPHVLDLDLELALTLVLELRLAARARECSGRLERDPRAGPALRLNRRSGNYERRESEERDRENDRALHDCLLEIGYSTKLVTPALGAGYAKAKSWFSLYEAKPGAFDRSRSPNRL